MSCIGDHKSEHLAPTGSCFDKEFTVKKIKTMDDDAPIEESELLSRLGMAVRDLWNTLPLYSHKQILDRACELEDWPEGTDVRKSLQTYLTRYDSTDPDEA